MTEEARRRRNETTLRELYQPFARQVAAVFGRMESWGYRPRAQQGWRSPADQLKAFETGHSKLKYGFHNVTGPAGEKQALALDVVDDDHPLAPRQDFMLALAAAARECDMQTGILWGLSRKLQAPVMERIQAGYPFSGAPLKIGWDPCHVEPTGITVAEARAGKRPEWKESAL